jgi:hypothetical protein
MAARLSRYISRREALALLFCAFTPSLVLGMPALFEPSGGAGWVLAAIAEVALIVAVVVGLPSIILLNSLRLYGLRYYLIAGLLAASGLSAEFVLPAIVSNGWAGGSEAYTGQITVLVILSEIASVSYWLVARPDRRRRSKSTD